MSGFLAYATGALLVLSAASGVARTVADEGDVAADSASLRSASTEDAVPGAVSDVAAGAVPGAVSDAAAGAVSGATSGVVPISGSQNGGMVWFLLLWGVWPVDAQTAVPPAPVVDASVLPSPAPSTPEDDASSSSSSSSSSSPAPDDEPSQQSGDESGGEADLGTAPPAAARVAGGPTLPAGTWLSGAAGEGAADGSMAEWRGTPFGIAGTFANDNKAMVELWQLRPDGEYGSWQESLDIAIGAIDDGESWAEAADGAYDDRWRESLTEARRLWEGRPGTLYIRFAHEMNGTWFPWSVFPGETQDFIKSWQRFRALQQEIFPDAQLVFCVNRDSSDNDLDWRTIFPGAEHVDVMGVDYYNMWPYVETKEEWAESLVDTDQYGAPRGLQAHLDFARSVGLPLSVGEWSGHADNGDSVAYMEGMHEFFATNAGSGPGQLLYEVHFNVDKDGGRWHLYGGDTRMPKSAEAYRALW